MSRHRPRITPRRATVPTIRSASTPPSFVCAWSARARTSGSRRRRASSSTSARGKINTDAIDNSAGVDTSDHEVNIKILLYDAIAKAELSGIEEPQQAAGADDRRGRTSRVARQLRTDAGHHDHAHSRRVGARRAVALHARTGAGRQSSIARSNTCRTTTRSSSGTRRTSASPRPEIAIILAYAKINLSPICWLQICRMRRCCSTICCSTSRTSCASAIARRSSGHRLRREIIATAVTNNMLNRLRPTFAYQASEETGKPAADVARAFAIVRDSFDLPSIWAGIESLDNKLPRAGPDRDADRHELVHRAGHSLAAAQRLREARHLGAGGGVPAVRRRDREASRLDPPAVAPHAGEDPRGGTARGRPFRNCSPGGSHRST